MSDSPNLDTEINAGRESPEHDIFDDTNETVTLSLDQLKQLLATNPKTKITAKADEEVIEEVDEPLSSDEEPDLTAAAVEGKLATFVNNRLIEPQPSAKIMAKFEKATRPTNIQNTKEVKISKALYKSMSIGAKKRDLELRKIHNMNSKAINNIVKVADAIVTKGKEPGKIQFSADEFKEMYSNIINGLGLVCQASQRINARRVSKTTSYIT